MTVHIDLPLVIGRKVREKLGSRGIEEDHLEEVVTRDFYGTHFRTAREGGLEVLGRDRGGRYLFIALYPSADFEGRWVVATARPMKGSEQKLYRRHMGD